MKIKNRATFSATASIAVGLMLVSTAFVGSASAETIGMSGVAAPSISSTSFKAVSLSTTEESQLRAYFDQYMVARATQDRLLGSLENGLIWDSFKTGVKSVSTKTLLTAGQTNTIETYADGSIAVTEVESPATLSTKAAVASEWGCTYTSAGSYGGYWKNCDVTVNLGIISQGFSLNYENIQGSGARITSYNRYHHFIIGGSLSGHRLERVSNTQVRYSADLDLASRGFPVGWTSWMQANQNGPTITTTHN